MEKLIQYGARSVVYIADIAPREKLLFGDRFYSFQEDLVQQFEVFFDHMYGLNSGDRKTYIDVDG